MASHKAQEDDALRIAADGYALHPSALDHLLGASGNIVQARRTYAAAQLVWSGTRVPDRVLAFRHATNLSTTRDGALGAEQSLEDVARDVLVPNEIERHRRVLFTRDGRAPSR